MTAVQPYMTAVQPYMTFGEVVAAASFFRLSMVLVNSTGKRANSRAEASVKELSTKESANERAFLTKTLFS
jgi:hypothetical protein